MKSLVCRECGNVEQFRRTARVTEEWVTDQYGNCAEVIESYDFETTDDISCFECDSSEVGWAEPVSETSEPSESEKQLDTLLSMIGALALVDKAKALCALSAQFHEELKSFNEQEQIPHKWEKVDMASYKKKFADTAASIADEFNQLGV